MDGNGAGVGFCMSFFCGPFASTLDDESVGFSSRRDDPSSKEFSPSWVAAARVRALWGLSGWRGNEGIGALSLQCGCDRGRVGKDHLVPVRSTVTGADAPARDVTLAGQPTFTR